MRSLTIILIIALSACTARLNPEQAKAIDTNFAVLQKANGIIVDRLDKCGCEVKHAEQESRGKILKPK